MNNDSRLNQWEKLVLETTYYHQLFERMVIESDFSHGYSWSLWWKWRARQINLESWRAQGLNPTELGILWIWLSLGSEELREFRVVNQVFLLKLGIVNHDDILDHVQHMISVARREHISKPLFFQNHTENAAKIVILRRAYEALDKQRVEWKLTDCEDRVIFGYVIAILWDRYHMRPYMLDWELADETWVSMYDHIFHDFNETSRDLYEKEWYGEIWRLFLQIRNEISRKKRNKILIEKGRDKTEEILNAIIANI